jgi:hypothetical protein
VKHAVPFVGCAGCHAGHADVFFAAPAVRARDAGSAKGQARRTRDLPGFATCPFSRSADHQLGAQRQIVGLPRLPLRGANNVSRETPAPSAADLDGGLTMERHVPLLGERPSDGGYAYRRAATAAWSASRGAVVGVCSAWH